MSNCRRVLLLRACGHRRAPVLVMRPMLALRRLSTTVAAPTNANARGDAGASAARATAAVDGKGASPELAAAAKKRRDDK